MHNVIIEYAEEYGMKMKAEETARRMLLKGYDPDEIADITGITLERLHEIAEKASLNMNTQ